MDRLIDLDAVRTELERRRAPWARHGLVVGEVTWRDAAAPWPQPIVTNRALVTDPESLGMTLTVGKRAAALLVLWTGGWADLEARIGDRVILDAPTFADVDSCVGVADGLAELLLGSASIR